MHRIPLIQTFGRPAGAIGILAGLLLLIGIATVHAQPAHAAGDCTVDAAAIGLDDEESPLLAMINAHRQANGRVALAQDATLNKAALWASTDSANRGFAPGNHIDTLGRDIPTRVTDCGYTTFTSIRENNYYGGGVEDGIDLASRFGAFRFWSVTSPAHNAALLDPELRFAGLARQCAGTMCYYTLVLGSHAGGPTENAGEATPELPYGPDTCKQGYVWREAFEGDTVCVTPERRTQVAADNAQAVARREPNGGAYGPDTCTQGWVWREARPSDLVCVTPEERDLVAVENAQANERRVVPR